MKIKIFDTNIHMLSAEDIEAQVNKFMHDHQENIINVKTACTNERLIITVIYKEEI